MFREEIYQLTYQALMMIMVVSAPPVLISMLAGLIVAIFQAATQIQEQTLSFTIKLAAALLVLMLMGGWIGAYLISFALNIFNNFPRWSG
ncbi:MAG: type III secretion system export apparatus subunit SctS [Parachlamydiales bacterium]